MEKNVEWRKRSKIGARSLLFILVVISCTITVHANEESIRVNGQLSKTTTQSIEAKKSTNNDPLLEKKTLVKSFQLRYPSTGEKQSTRFMILGILLVLLASYTLLRVHFRSEDDN